MQLSISGPGGRPAVHKKIFETNFSNAKAPEKTGEFFSHSVTRESPTYLRKQHFRHVSVRSALVEKPDAQDGRHLDVVRDVQFGGGGRQQRVEMNTQGACRERVHGSSPAETWT